MSPDREPGDSAFWDSSHEEQAAAAAAEPERSSPTLPGPPASRAHEREELPIVAWARAIALGVRDTAQDMLDEGRRGAKAKQSQMWDKFDRKTKGRRTRDQ